MGKIYHGIIIPLSQGDDVYDPLRSWLVGSGLKGMGLQDPRYQIPTSWGSNPINGISPRNGTY